MPKVSCPLNENQGSNDQDGSHDDVNNEATENAENQNESSHMHAPVVRGPGNNDGDSRQNDSTGTSPPPGEFSQNESSQTDERQSTEVNGSHETVNDNSTHESNTQLLSELQEFKTKNAEYTEIIKTLKQTLNMKEDTIQQMSSQMAKLMMDHQQRAIPKLPNFSGGPSENIEVWITQFDESLYFLSDAEKLQEMLPKFRETAADFVFGQLTYAERSDYQTLLSQLELRFKTIETPRMFQIQFDNRKQRVGESVHDFACELKRLYEKAYPRRPWKVRDEDLVRKFMNCILDRQAGAQVEYHQCPKTIDHAVYEMVHYSEVFGQSDATSLGRSPTSQSN